MDQPGSETPVAPTLGHGRYLIGRELGRGAMGVVYEAEDTVLARIVAVKTIELVFTPGEEARRQFEQRFFTEARVAARLAHPGIVVCHDVGKDPASGKLFIVFEYLKGETLAARAPEGPMGWRDALAVVGKVARAIHHAHEHGVVHRDLKPANIMLLDGRRGPASAPRGDVAVKIMDFGVARLESLGPRLTGPGLSFGSPLYSSPEQLLGEKCNARSDIFSLGSVLCTLLLGRPWFDAPSIPEIVHRVVHAGPPRVSSLRPDVPAALDAVLAAALAKREDDRYASAAEMADDLDDVLAGGSPRHAGAMGPFSPPVHGVAEDALLEGLAVPGGPGRVPAADGSGPLAALLDEATLSLRRLPATMAPAPAPARRWLAPAGAMIALALLAAGAAFWWPRPAPLESQREPSGPLRSDEAPVPSALPAPRAISPSFFLGPAQNPVAPSAAPATVETPAVAEMPATARPPAAASAPPASVIAPSPSDVPEAEAAASGTEPAPAAQTRIRFSVEHPFENARMIVWIDGVLAFEAKLQAPAARKIVGIKVRDGRLEQLVDVGPGPHEVRVEVAWDLERRVATKIADTAAGSTGLLEVRVGRMSKNLSLQWSRLAKE